MEKFYTSLGLMSGTSMDGVDASVIRSDGENNYEPIFDKYFEYDEVIYSDLLNLRDKITSSKDLEKYRHELKSIEKEITLFHAKVANIMIKATPEWEPDIIGLHGQTIFHNSDEKLSVQLGDGKLLSQLTKKTVIYEFRNNDLKNGGQGAPLTPIFHQHLVRKLSDKSWPVLVLNIGGISNVTSISRFQELTDNNKKDDAEMKLFAGDIAPGNCLIDEWIRNNSKYKYDRDGLIAKSGKVNKLILNQAIDNFLPRKNHQTKSLDVKDFDTLFVRGLSLEDGAATLTHFTARLISEGLIHFMLKNYAPQKNTLSKAVCLVCGGGRKNKYLIETLKKNLKIKELVSIDEYGHDGDFTESEAFAYLAIRSYLGLPISFPNTTGCKEPSTGGVLVKNY